MNIWLFQATDKYILKNEVPNRPDDWWLCKQHWNKVGVGDVCLFWQAGKDAGIYAVGLVKSPVYMDGDERKVDIQYGEVVDPPILKSALLDHPILKDLGVIEVAHSKNPYSVTSDQRKELQKLLGEFWPLTEAETAERAKPFPGERQYQKLAVLALPILVLVAENSDVITYSELAAELGIRPRNLNYPLGSIGQRLMQLGKEWGETIPPIQCLVINKNSKLPSEGINWFLNKQEFEALSKGEQERKLNQVFQEVYDYDRWSDVLKHLSIKPITKDFGSLIEKAAQYGGGETAEHKALKEYVANHPELIAEGLPKGQTEVVLPSADKLDVKFEVSDAWIAVEVKSRISPEADVARGIFQCIKYQAVMEAEMKSRGMVPKVMTILVTEKELTPQLAGLKNTLGVKHRVITPH
ncbi:MAG: hypothetical protein QM811_07210 [Pirellulales bacterium]